MNNSSTCNKNSLSEPSRSDRGRFKSTLDISNIKPHELLQLLKTIRGYSYSELGREFGGYSKSHINEIFHGKKVANIVLQNKIADFFKLPVNYLWKL